MKSAKLWKVQNYAKCQIAQDAKNAKCSIMNKKTSLQYPHFKCNDTKETIMILVVLFRFYETGSVKPGSIGGTKPKVELTISAN